MVLAHCCATSLGISPKGYAMARAFERLEGWGRGHEKAERWASELSGHTQSATRLALMRKHCPELRLLGGHPIWSALGGEVQSPEGWQQTLARGEADAATRIGVALGEPFQQLPEMAEPDHLACLIMLLKSTPVGRTPHRIVFGRGIMNSVAKLCLFPGWYPTRYRLKSLLECQLPLHDPYGGAATDEPTDDQVLDDAIEAYRLLFEWGQAAPLFHDLSEPAWAMFCCAFEHARPLLRLEIVEALADHQQRPASPFRLPLLRRMWRRALRAT
jgi:hypothetical protein